MRVTLPVFAGDVADVGVRVGRFGAPVMTLRRHNKRMRFGSDGALTWETDGLVPWRDVKRADITEVAAFLKGRPA